MAEQEIPSFNRRRLLIGAGALGAGALLAGCTNNGNEQAAGTAPGGEGGDGTGGTAVDPVGEQAQPGAPVTIGFSAPAADHGWIAAITENARNAAAEFEEVTLEVTEGTNDVNQQISQVETLINRGVDVLVILPFDGSALTTIARQAMDAGIPVVNVDRIFDSPLAYRTYIGGDNYGMGVSAGNYIAARLEELGVSDPVIAEIAGIDDLPLTQERSQGFRDALESHGLEVSVRQAASFTVESGQEVAANMLQGTNRIDAMWNHDDDQGIGVLAAIEEAGRDEFFMVGGAGSRNAMEAIQRGDSVLEATVLYNPSMSASGIRLARLLGQNAGMGDLVEREVPAFITTFSAVVTAENVDQYLDLGFAS
jgi:ribose transport system substrate-binding protein